VKKTIFICIIGTFVLLFTACDMFKGGSAGRSIIVQSATGATGTPCATLTFNANCSCSVVNGNPKIDCPQDQDPCDGITMPDPACTCNAGIISNCPQTGGGGGGGTPVPGSTCDVKTNDQCGVRMGTTTANYMVCLIRMAEAQVGNYTGTCYKPKIALAGDCNNYNLCVAPNFCDATGKCVAASNNNGVYTQGQGACSTDSEYGRCYPGLTCIQIGYSATASSGMCCAFRGTVGVVCNISRGLLCAPPAVCVYANGYVINTDGVCQDAPQ